MPDLRPRAWRRWQAAAGPWRGWAGCPALTMPTEAPLPLALPEQPGALPEVVAALGNRPTALVLDLDPVTGARVAAALSARRLAHVVLLLLRWPHADAVLPTDALVATLLAAAPQLRTWDGQHVAFVLDGERSASIERPANDPRIDNRYDLAAGDLPSLRDLRAAGIERVVKLTRAASH